MADETSKEWARDAATGQMYQRDTANYGGAGKSTASAVADRQDKAKSALQAAAARAKEKTPMPKQQEGESPSAYSERLRKWRAGEQ